MKKIIGFLSLLVVANASAQIIPQLGENQLIDETVFVTNQFTSGVRPAVVALDGPPAGAGQARSFALTWLQKEPEVSPEALIWVAIVDSDGELLAGPTAVASELRQGATGSWVIFGQPSIASDGQGLFSVVWPSFTRLGGAHFQSLLSRTFHPTANTNPGNDSVCPLDGLGAGPQDGSWNLDDIVLMDESLLDALVSQSGNIYEIEENPTGLDLAATPQGRFVMTFPDQRSAGNWGVFLAGTDLDVSGLGGNPQNGCPSGSGGLVPLDINPDAFGPIQVTPEGEYRVRPRLDINPNSQRTVVTWRNRFGEIQAQRFLRGGSPVGGRKLVAERSERTRITNHDPVVAYNPQGQIWIAWEQSFHENPDGRASSSILASWFDGDLNVVSEAAPLTTSQPPGNTTLMYPKRGVELLARDLEGNLAATWREDAVACGMRGATLSVGGANCVVEGDQFDEGAQSCQVSLTFNSTERPSCRVGLKIDPADDDDPSTWIRFREDIAQEWSNSESQLDTFLEFEQNTIGANRCAWLNNYGTSANQLLIVQRCPLWSFPIGCQPCEAEESATEQVVVNAMGAVEATPGQGTPDGLELESEGFESDIYVRWLQDGFNADNASYVPQVLFNDYPANPAIQRSAPALAMHRSGEFLVSWMQWDTNSISKVFTQSAEGPVELSINDIGILEGELGRAIANFTVTASKPYPRVAGDTDCTPAPTVSLLTADDTASTLTGDYELTEATLSFNYRDDGFGNPCGNEPPSAISFNVPVTNDTIFEDTESFLVDLFDEENAIVVKRQGIGVIVDNDLPEEVSFPSATFEICENGTIPQATAPRCPADNPNPRDFVELELTLEYIQEVDGTVEFQTMNGVDQGDTVGAIAGIDYEGISGEVQFLAGTDSAFLSVNLIDNAFTEPTKRFQVLLTDSVDLTLGAQNVATVLILNDDNCETPPQAYLPDPNQAVPFNLPAGGSDVERQGYLCVENISDNDGDGTIDGCPWESQLLDSDGNGVFLTLEDFARGQPGTADLVTDHCSLRPNTTGVIRYSADPNTPAGTGEGTEPRSDAIQFVDGSAEPASITIIQNGSSSCTPIVAPGSFQFLPVGGEGQFLVSFADAEACIAASWPVVVNGGGDWFTLESVDGSGTATSGSGPGLVTFSVAPVGFMEGDRQAEISVGNSSVTVNQEGAFYDHFSNGVPPDPSLWTYNDPDAWSEADTYLTGSSGGELTLIADPAFPGCSECALQTTMRIDSFSKGQATLYMWYRNPGEYLALSMDEFTNTWTLTQRTAGVDHVLRTLTSDILVGEEYSVILAFELEAGSNPIVLAYVGGQAMCPEPGSGGIVCTPWDPDPDDPDVDPVIGSGVVGLGVSGTTASFNYLDVLRADALQLPLDVIFMNNFE